MQFADAIKLLDAAKVSYRKLYALADEPKNLVARMTVLAREDRINSREIVKDGGVHDLHTAMMEHPFITLAVACDAEAFAALRLRGRDYLELVTDVGMLRAGIVAWWKGRPDHYPATYRTPFILSDVVPEDEVRTLDGEGNVTRFFWLDFEKV